MPETDGKPEEPKTEQPKTEQVTHTEQTTETVESGPERGGDTAE